MRKTEEELTPFFRHARLKRSLRSSGNLNSNLALLELSIQDKQHTEVSTKCK